MYVQEKEITGWGNYPRVKTKVYQPFSQHEAFASLKAEKNIPRGLGRSYGDQAVNADRLATVCTRLNHFLSFDKNTGLLECEAGVSHDEIIRIFAPRGWFPMITPGTKYITIGGAIANNIHGKAHHVDGSFVNCVEAFTILLADGSIKTASRTENSDLFWANFGGLGLLGIILTAKIRLRPIETTYFHQKAVVLHNLDAMIDALYEYDEQYNYSVAWVDALAKGKHLGRGVLTLGNHARLAELPPAFQKKPLYIAPPPKLSVPFYLPDFALNTFTIHLLNKVLDIMQRSAGRFAHYEKFFYPLDFVSHWNRGYGKRGFIQYQFVIPVENVKQNIRVILEKIASSGCAPFLNVLKKLGEGQNYLSFSQKGFTFAIDFPVTKNIPNLIRELDQLVLHFGGRIYLGKDAMLDKETFRAMYPHYEEWLSIKAKYDPGNKFSSNISRRLGLEADASVDKTDLLRVESPFEAK